MPTQFLLKLQPQVKLQQVVSSTLLQVSRAELEQVIERELAANPALERVRDRIDVSARTNMRDIQHDELYPRRSASGRAERASGTGMIGASEQLVARPSALDRLGEELALLAAGQDLMLARRVLHMLDDHGYLRSTAAAVAAELEITPGDVERLVGILQQLEPPGVGARDLRECLLLQCAHLAARGVECTTVQRMLGEAWDAVATQNWRQVARRLRLKPEAVAVARRFMAGNLYPYPLALLINESATTQLFICPDIIIRRTGSPHGEKPAYHVEIPGSEAHGLVVSQEFASSFHSRSVGEYELRADDVTWIQQHVCQARMFLASLRQRWATLHRIGEYLVDYQTPYLERGPRYLRPLTRAAVAAALDMHESTVSRAIRDKVVQLPHGNMQDLAQFFDSSLAAKAAMKDLMMTDGQKMSDRELAEALEAQGLTLARRTVAKYREQLQISIGYHRNQGAPIIQPSDGIQQH
jgi:RNA polymerase sigma-54 factor